MGYPAFLTSFPSKLDSSLRMSSLNAFQGFSDAFSVLPQERELPDKDLSLKELLFTSQVTGQCFSLVYTGLRTRTGLEATYKRGQSHLALL